ncbi:MAG: ribonuclease R [Verrucomicrobia bacterium]|nr:ribonuclease R [Verrucomicrobiota bacterium]
MKSGELKQAVLEHLHAEHRTPPSAHEISAALELRGGQKKRLQKLLNELLLAGEIVRIRGNRYSIGAEADLVTGRLDVSKRGDGYVQGPGGSCVAFVPRHALETALPGDTVVVRLGREIADRITDDRVRVGRVIRILTRAQREIVGTLKKTDRFLYVVPMDPRYKKDFYVPEMAGAEIGDRVIIRFAGWADPHINPEAEIVESLGPADTPSQDTIAAIRHYGLPDDFPGEGLSEAETVSSLIDRPGRRLDCRDLFILTIDPARARDFDDALSLERDEQGRRVLGVHIADVSHFVRPRSALDKEARVRGNSVYLPDRVIPMLPEQLSNGVCSLVPDVDRLAFSVFMTIDDRGQVLSSTFARTRIRSRRRFTYEDVLPVLQGQKPAGVGKQAIAQLRELHRLAQQFRKRRFATYALELDAPEPEVVVDEHGVTTGIRMVPNDETHQLVEECMVAANEATARELSERNVPSIYRVHAPPSAEKMQDLMAELAGLGYTPGDLTNRKNLATFLRSVKGEARADYVRLAVLKSMNRAEYTPERAEHFGLAKQYYGHFTSPIRRYPDLIVHRQLAALLLQQAKPDAKRKPTMYKTAELVKVSAICSDTERRADEAERAVIEIKKYRYLKRQLDEGTQQTYEAVVVSVMNFGLFVEIPALQVQGLVHVRELSSGFVRHDRTNQSLRAGKKRYVVETRLQVVINNVDMEGRKLDFALARA